jgi:YMGG-like Gly-zipper
MFIPLELGRTIGRLAGGLLSCRPDTAKRPELRASVNMKQCLTLFFLLVFATAVLPADAVAQTARGAVSGAIIGGAVGGRRGAAIGATAGAVAGASRRHRHWHNYYWRHGQCWYRSRSGRSHPVSHRYCRRQGHGSGSPAAMRDIATDKVHALHRRGTVGTCGCCVVRYTRKPMSDFVEERIGDSKT